VGCGARVGERLIGVMGESVRLGGEAALDGELSVEFEAQWPLGPKPVKCDSTDAGPLHEKTVTFRWAGFSRRRQRGFPRSTKPPLDQQSDSDPR
jgi:hypothetical protein